MLSTPDIDLQEIDGKNLPIEHGLESDQETVRTPAARNITKSRELAIAAILVLCFSVVVCYPSLAISCLSI